MRKYLVGFMVGILLALPLSVFADDISNVGKRIVAEFVVKLDGEELPVKAVAFEGTSYAPVRAVGEALGLDVDFEDGVVILQKTVNEEVRSMAEERLNDLAKDGEIPNTIEVIDRFINNIEIALEAHYWTVESDYVSEPAKEHSMNKIKELEIELEQLKQRKRELESQ